MGAAAITQSNPADFANRIQKYFSRQLLKALTYNLRLGSYGTPKDLPANSAANTIRFFRPRRARKGDGTKGPRALTEGTAPTENSDVPIGYVDIQLKQRGDVSSISDIVRAIDLLDTLDVYVKTLGGDAALDFDGVCLRSICSNPGVADADGFPNPIPVGQTTMYGSNTNFERFSGVAPTLNSANDFASLAALTANNAKLTRAVHLGCVTRMKGTKGSPGVPMINGKYVCVVPPEILFDIRQDATWISAAVFDAANLRNLYRWAEFELDGAVFVEQNNPFIENATYGTYDTAGGIFSVLYLGEEAFGVPKLSSKTAGSDPRMPSMIILTQPDKSDPLNQKVTLGWKAFYQSGLLLTNETTDQPHVVQLRCKTTFQ